MGNGEMDNFTLRHIRLFLAAARFENFSTAARYMYMTQPMVSRIIANMEQAMGVQLFYRGSRKVALTPAGRALAEAWGELVACAEAGVRRAQDVQAKQRRRIAIGNDYSADRDAYFYPVMSAYNQMFPDLEIDIEHGETAKNIEKLRKGRLDFVYAMLYDAPGLDESALTWKLLRQSPLIAYVPPDSPLYDRESLKAGDLQGEPLLLLSPNSPSGYTAAIQNYLRQQGVNQGERHYLASMWSINYNLFQGKGIFIGNAFTNLLHREHFHAFPLPDSKDGLIAVWRREDTRPSVLKLVDSASRFFENK